MKILFLTHYDNMYGANKALISLMLSLKQEGKEVMLVIPAEGEMTERLRAAEIPYIISTVTAWEAPFGTLPTFLKKRAKRKNQIARELNFLYDKTKNLGIDVVHTNSSVMGTGAMLAEKLGCKHIWHVREYGKEHFGNVNFYPAKRVQAYYEKADAIVAISDALKTHIQEKYPAAKVRRIYDGVSLDKEPVLRKSSDADHIIRFVYLGYLFPMKHQLDVMKACILLKKQGVRNFQVTLAGGGGHPYGERLKRFKERYHLQNVQLPGYVKEPYAMLEESDVGIIASEYEGFGLVTVEYMLHEMPVIGRKSGATPELIKNGETGFLYETPQQLADKMKYLITHEEARKALGSKGRMRAQETFPLPRNVEEILALYREL